MNSNLISLVIPTFNRGNLIAETINSVLNQSWENWELILVDDGSTDNTDGVIQNFLKDRRIKYFKRPANRLPGGNAARNYGFEKSKGELIKWLDSDDLLAHHCLEKQIKLIQKGGYDVVFSRSRFFSNIDDNGNFTWDKYWSESFPLEDPFRNYLFGKVRFSTADGLWKKEFIGAPPFKEDLKNSQEWLMIIQHLSNEPEYLVDNEVLVYSRLHGGQMHNKKNVALYYSHQILARYYAVLFLNSKKKLSWQAFKYLHKNMLVNFLAPLKKGKFRYVATNFSHLIKSFLISMRQFLNKNSIDGKAY